ncbi:uncharacterized protein LOC114957861 isoform X2 [Acropora millepora]|uniref:uncharacterized protein LOC114957861 isoform X2 n=1 Tax=Acropora millepora TaxID=45264 RepID=UPI001CF55A9A|nr:uncharacterized protein LOC114957861 isoform X2 [Acropora millepora]
MVERKLLLKQSGFFLYIAALCKSFVSADEVPLQFERNWCRERKIQVDWRVYTQVCPGYTRHWAQEYWANNLKTDSNLSYISGAEINPAGQFSHIYIQSVTVLNNTKTFGGDAWRMRIKGPSDLVASVYDFQNGTYEAVFLPMEPGYYSLQIVLDYTLCHALKNPPPDWFRKGCRHGSFQLPGTLNCPDDYIDKPLYYGAYFTINVRSATPQDTQYFDDLSSTSERWCNGGCNSTNLLWDGFGRWNNGNWVPYKRYSTNPPRSGHRQGTGVLWIYGDSHNRRFYESLQRRRLCSHVFVACYHTDVWVYALGPEGSKEMDVSLGGNDINVTQILEELNQVVTQPQMNEDSALVLNAGVHLLKSTTFKNYQKIIRGFIKLLKDNYHGKAVWKTIPSLGRQTELYTGCCRRFHTEQRIKLFNAYAMSKMCEASIPVLDIYPISASYAEGTIDGIHYPHSVFYSAEEALEKYLTT